MVSILYTELFQLRYEIMLFYRLLIEPKIVGITAVNWWYFQKLVISSAVLLYPHSIHFNNLLLFIIFYKYKYLLTWHRHWMMILINWFLEILLAIKPVFFDGDNIYEMYSTVAAFISSIIYRTLVCCPRQSTH
jgi:hypothetical protein